MDDSSAADDLLRLAGALSRWASTQAGLDVPSGVLRLLAIVEERGPIRIGDLAHADQTSQPAVTRQASRLEELGWVERIADPADARATLVSVTDAGRSALLKARRARGRAVGRLLDEADLPVQRIRETTQLLEQLLQATRRVAGEE
ncbi:MarR family winged helix-turn-helix transcriptional regulator [Micropruina sp.]|uniref:MarR family winged helix-turn-helix transcriptional regulator n=1 Tax=Micropruina sp. TaxID=2737536 RepID=UPI0039E5DD53